MMKNIGTQQQQKQQEAHVEENMSNLTSSAASGGDQASAASSNNGGSNNNNNNNMYRTFSHHLTHQPQQQPNKKKRNQPGNPDPDAEVISLSPHSLLATNRFVCDVCNKGFQRDQNLQLHRRGHNLPWKLKQRNKQDVIRKKVYVCPEISCVHHDPSRALGDLTGIKKHFCRKHGEKKWKCDKCSKKYAVQSDWKAHSKTCGTREYRCDCGTLFSRRDSFITHRAFCDALAEESARNTTTTTNNIISNNNIPLHHVQCSSSATPTMLSHNQINLQHHLQFNNASSVHEQQQQQQQFPLFHIKREQYEQQQQSFTLRHPEMPPWLSCPLPIMGPPQIDLTTTTTPSSTSSIFQDFQQNHDHHHHPNPNPNGTHMGPIFNHPASPHISATALLQKAAQMGSKSTTTTNSSSPPPPGAVFMNMIRPTPHVSAAAADSCLNLSSRDHQLINGLSSYGNKAAAGAVAGANTSNNNNNNNNTSSLLHEMMMMNNPAHPLPNSSFDQEFGSFHAASLGKNSGNHNDQDGMTRDFLGLRPLSQSDFMMSIAGLSNCMNSDGSSVAAAACTEQNQKYLAR